MVNITFGETYEKEIFNIPISDSTVSCRIQDMSEDVESQVIASVEDAEFFAIQFDESTDITGHAQRLAFSSFVTEKSLNNPDFAKPQEAKTFLM